MANIKKFIFSGDRLWVRLAPDGRVEPWQDGIDDAGWIKEPLLAEDGDAPWAVEAPTDPSDATVQRCGLRALYDRMAPEDYGLAQQGLQLLHWRRTHRFCGICGGPLQRKNNGERAMHCPACRQDFFPRLNPVVITRISRGHEILLARRAAGPFNFYSVIAGFVEAGESLEQAVAREIREEVGIEVRRIRYFASQPWPFPNNLMIAFTAEYASGAVRPDGIEIGEAGWFPRDRLPEIPHPISISRRLIDDFAANGPDGV